MGVILDWCEAVTVSSDGMGGGRVTTLSEGIGNGERSGMGAKLRSDVNERDSVREDVSGERVEWERGEGTTAILVVDRAKRKAETSASVLPLPPDTETTGIPIPPAAT